MGVIKQQEQLINNYLYVDLLDKLNPQRANSTSSDATFKAKHRDSRRLASDNNIAVRMIESKQLA